MTVFLLGRCCSFLGATIFDGPYCWLFNCSYFASIIIIIMGRWVARGDSGEKTQSLGHLSLGPSGPPWWPGGPGVN